MPVSTENYLELSSAFSGAAYLKLFVRVPWNLPKVVVMHAAEVNAEQILRPKHVVVLDDAVATLAERIK